MSDIIERFRKRVQDARAVPIRTYKDQRTDREREEIGGDERHEDPPLLLARTTGGQFYSGIIPPEFTSTRDDFTEKLEKKFSEMEYVIPPLPEKYRNIPALHITRMSNNSFEDDAWKDRTPIVLKRLTDVQTIEYGRLVMRSLQEGTSQYLIGLIFIVAYQLRVPGMGSNIHALPPEDELGIHKGLEVGALNKDVEATTGASAILEERGSEFQQSQAYAYLAASLFKMFTRSPENYTKSWNHILLGFKKFYSYGIPLRLSKPDPNVLAMIHENFSLSELFKTSLYRFLYNANKSGKITGVQSFLYDIHLSHTGMHVVSIAYRLCMSLNCTPGTLLQVIHGNRFGPQLDDLATIFRLMDTDEEKYARRLWRYGRLFDSTFMANLQTRACPKFVYLLACMLKRENAISASGILDIKQLEEVSAEDQKILWLGSRIMVTAIGKLVDGEQRSLITQIMNV